MITKPCPFCCNPTTDEYDVGGACCFCDYEGDVSIGKYGMFKSIEQYEKIINASSHEDRMDKLHERDSHTRVEFLDVDTIISRYDLSEKQIEALKKLNK